MQLGLADIPWPMVIRSTCVDDLSPQQIELFFLAKQKVSGSTLKEVIKSALLRWHPDKFGSFLARVREEDRKAAEEGVGIVARCLNRMMEST